MINGLTSPSQIALCPARIDVHCWYASHSPMDVVDPESMLPAYVVKY